MAKKNEMTPEQNTVLGRTGLIPRMREVRQDLPNSLIICSKITGEIRLIEKKRIPN